MLEDQIYLALGLIVLLVPLPIFAKEMYLHWKCINHKHQLNCAISEKHLQEHLSLASILVLITAAAIINNCDPSYHSPMTTTAFVLWALFIYGATLHFKAEREGTLK